MEILIIHLRLFVSWMVWIAWCCHLSQNCSTTAFVIPSSSFVHPLHNHPYTLTNSRRNKNDKKKVPCYLSSDEDDFGMIDRNSPLAQSLKRTSILHFLTQRSIQSFMFLLVQCRDPHTSDWIERMTNTTNLLEYHGTGAFNLTRFPEWDSVLRDMIDRPKSKIIIEAKRRGGGHGGWSKNNPYLKPRYVEFEIVVDPLSLVPRILSVQEQIAKEWVKDLKTLANANNLILDSYHNNTLEARQVEEDSRTDENVPSDYYDEDQQTTTFNRVSMTMLLDKHAFEDKKPSPVRKGSFDLLSVLALQESIHRVLRNYKTGGDHKKLSFQWLRDFYIDKLDEHFDGNGPYGRADDFLEELLLTTPSIMKYYKDNEKMIQGIIDPLAIATDVIHMRTEVALEWRQTVKHVQDHHMSIRKSLFDKQMSKWEGNNNQNENVENKISSNDGRNDNQLEINNNEFQ